MCGIRAGPDRADYVPFFNDTTEVYHPVQKVDKAMERVARMMYNMALYK